MAAIRHEGQRTDIICSSALEFVSILDPLNGAYPNPPGLPLYIFRGAPSEQHDLRPSAYRPSASLLHQGKWTAPPIATVGAQCEAELATLKRFFDIAADHGIRLPEDSQVLRARLEAWDTSLRHATPKEPITWPPPEFLSLIALAQHHGLATRALDWSWNALVAAYFAARGAMMCESQEIAVWVFMFFSKTLDKMLEIVHPGWRPLILYTAPGAENENLRAQKGLFMLQLQRVEDYDAPFEAFSYDALLGAALPSMPDADHITRVLVSSKYAGSVLRFLACAGVSAASVFPGLWGVAREIEEDRWLSSFPSYIEVSPLGRQIEAQIAESKKDRGA